MCLSSLYPISITYTGLQKASEYYYNNLEKIKRHALQVNQASQAKINELTDRLKHRRSSENTSLSSNGYNNENKDIASQLDAVVEACQNESNEVKNCLNSNKSSLECSNFINTYKSCIGDITKTKINWYLYLSIYLYIYNHHAIVDYINAS